MAPPRSQRRRRARLRKSLIGKDFRARKSEMLIHPPPPCGRPRRRHIGAQLRCCEPRGRMSCGSPMPRGEQIAIPAEWGRPTGRFFCVVGQALRVLPSDTSPETKVSSCRPSDAVVPELEAYERKRPHERQHRPWQERVQLRKRHTAAATILPARWTPAHLPRRFGCSSHPVFVSSAKAWRKLCCGTRTSRW